MFSFFCMWLVCACLLHGHGTDRTVYKCFLVACIMVPCVTPMLGKYFGCLLNKGQVSRLWLDKIKLLFRFFLSPSSASLLFLLRSALLSFTLGVVCVCVCYATVSTQAVIKLEYQLKFWCNIFSHFLASRTHFVASLLIHTLRVLNFHIKWAPSL